MLVQHILFNAWKHHFKLFGLGGTAKPGEEEGHLLSERLNKLITTVFIEQPQALPGSANYIANCLIGWKP